MIRRHVLPYLTVLALVAHSGCGGSDRRDGTARPPPATGAPRPLTVGPAGAVPGALPGGDGARPGGTPLLRGDPGFTGHWHSARWGDHYIVVQGTTVKMIYAHDRGHFVGTLAGSTATGWWMNDPSRRPPVDAGEVTFTLVPDAGGFSIDGSWRYGTNGTLVEGWDLAWIDDKIPHTVARRLADRSKFIAHP